MGNSKFFNGFRNGFKDFGGKVTNAVNFILLSIVYFIGVGTTSLFSKLIGKHFLDLKPNKSSYWVKRKPIKTKIEEHYRQF